VIARRARSPLRWLWVVSSSLVILLLAGAFDFPWLLLLVPFTAAALLLAPPLGMFRHDETPPPRTGVFVAAREVEAGGSSLPGARRFLLTLINDGEEVAEGFRMRLLVPAAIWPRGGSGSPLARLHVGEMGRQWSIESVYDDTSVTFRAGPPGGAGSVSCAPGERVDLAELTLVNLDHFAGDGLEYQINGGTVKTALWRIALPASR